MKIIRLPDNKHKKMRRRWNAFVGWVLYYPLGGVEKLRKKAWRSNYSEIRHISAGVYHEYLVRNAVKSLDRQVESWLRSRGEKVPSMSEKINHMMKLLVDWRDSSKKE